MGTRECSDASVIGQGSRDKRDKGDQRDPRKFRSKGLSVCACEGYTVCKGRYALHPSSMVMTTSWNRLNPARRLLVSVTCVASVAACGLVTSPRESTVPRSATLQPEDVTFASASGSLIRAWFIRGKAGVGAVLLLPGVGADRTSMEGRALFLHARGFTVLAPDFQASGESPGHHVTYGARESLDADAAMTFLRDSARDERVGVIGVSMGGAATLLGHGPLLADAFVLESVYPTIRQAVSNRLGTWLGPLGGIARLFTSPVISLVGSVVGVKEAELQPISRIAAIRAPLLLIAGTDDPYTPIAEAESLFARAPNPKTFWAVGGAAHVDLHDYTPRDYERRVGGFLEEHLRVMVNLDTLH